MAYTTLTKMQDGDYPVTLLTNSTGKKYRVIYGEQVKDFDNWQAASHEFGYCVFHSLECASKIVRGNHVHLRSIYWLL